MRHALAFAVVSVWPAVAAAQTVPSTSLVAEFQPIALDARSAPSSDFTAETLVAPLRLSLENSIVPIGSQFAGCATHDEPSGNSRGGIPLSFQRAFRLTPLLVLAGFSQLGCPIDANIGGTLAFTIAIAPHVSLVLAGGLIAAPGQLQLSNRANPATNAAARADVMWTTRGGRTYGVGVGTIGFGKTGVAFTGGF